MLTDEDIKNLKEVLATKDDLNNIAAKLVTFEEFDKFKDEIREDFSNLRESIQALIISVDGLVKELSVLRTEYAAIKNQVTRHETWLLQVANKLGIKLEY